MVVDPAHLRAASAPDAPWPARGDAGSPAAWTCSAAASGRRSRAGGAIGGSRQWTLAAGGARQWRPLTPRAAGRGPSRRRGRRRTGRPPFLAYINDDESEATLRMGLADHLDSLTVRRGGIRAAIRALERERTPRVLVVDLSDEDDPVGALDGLAGVCEPDVTRAGDRRPGEHRVLPRDHPRARRVRVPSQAADPRQRGAALRRARRRPRPNGRRSAAGACRGGLRRARRRRRHHGGDQPGAAGGGNHAQPRRHPRPAPPRRHRGDHAGRALLGGPARRAGAGGPRGRPVRRPRLGQDLGPRAPAGADEGPGGRRRAHARKA